MRAICLITILTFAIASAAVTDVEDREICPDEDCDTECDGQSCNYCSGSNCCRNQQCNSCVNECRNDCSTSNCNNQCIQSCQVQQSCSQCNNCYTRPCRQRCRSCYRQPEPVKIEKAAQSKPVSVSSASSTNPQVNVTTDIDIYNYINNTNIIKNPVTVNSTNINNIELSRPATSNTVIPPQPCCQSPPRVIPQPVPVYVPRPYPVVQHVPVPVVRHVQVPVPQPYPVPVTRLVHQPVYIPRPVPVQPPCPVYGGCADTRVQACGQCSYCQGQYNPQFCSQQSSCPSSCRTSFYNQLG